MAGTVKLGRSRVRKITPEQEEELLQAYIKGGRALASPLCVQYGVSPTYAGSVAASRGIARPQWRRGNRYLDNKVDRSVRTHDDPRWARARAIGEVIA